jgi:hypothetical protein
LYQEKSPKEKIVHLKEFVESGEDWVLNSEEVSVNDVTTLSI